MKRISFARTVIGSRSIFGAGCAICLSLCLVARTDAQSIILDNVTNTDSAFIPAYRYTQNGLDPYGPISFYNFLFEVSSGTGLGAGLVGGSYMGFCVNTFFSDPADGYQMLVDTTGSVLSYSWNGSPDYWNINTALKMDAFRDVLANYSLALVTTPVASTDFGRMIAAFSMLAAEIALDYDGTSGSLNLSAGANRVADPSGNPVSGVVLDLYNDMKASVGSGDGAGFVIYAAAWPDPNPATGAQDMIFFNTSAAIPEASTILLSLGAMALIARRRRS